VDGANASCSATATGTQDDPYCTIAAALAAHHDPGTTIQVQPGVYRERVLVTASGADGLPIVLQGSAGTVVDGADDFSDPDLWSAQTGAAWLAGTVNWNPNQVFVDSLRLTPWAGDPANLPTNSFVYVFGSGLYVNIGGENPGLHLVLVGHRSYGFQLSHRSWVTVRGFTIDHADLKGVYMTQGSSNVEVSDNTIRQPFRYGIQVDTCASMLVRGNVVTHCGDHGIAFTRATTASSIERNESAWNAAPVRQANGIYLFNSPLNVILDNRCHHNQDSGVQIQSGSNSTVCVQNRSWLNGDHGFDTLKATRNVYVGNVSYGNFRDGFSFEGFSSQNSLYDCIATDNGLQTGEIDLWLDNDSIVGFRSDYNMFWNSTSQAPVKVGIIRFASVADYSARYDLDFHTFQMNPLFSAPDAGDFHLSKGSPAIDAANTDVPDWPALDAEGNTRSNDLRSPDFGLGPVAYADRGALEYGSAELVDGGTSSQPPIESEPNLLANAPAPFRSGVQPNPVRGGATIRFSLKQPGRARLYIVDAGGRVVRSLLDVDALPGGDHTLAWDATDHAGAPLRAGMYYWLLRSASGAESGRFALVR
jgi:hypothetical protein